MSANRIANQINNLHETGLKWCKKSKTYIGVEMHPTVIIRDGLIIVSAEDGAHFADYYGEYRGNMPWIHPDLEAIAGRHNAYWEWESAGSISLSTIGL